MAYRKTYGKQNNGLKTLESHDPFDKLLGKGKSAVFSSSSEADPQESTCDSFVRLLGKVSSPVSKKASENDPFDQLVGQIENVHISSPRIGASDCSTSYSIEPMSSIEEEPEKRFFSTMGRNEFPTCPRSRQTKRKKDDPKEPTCTGLSNGSPLPEQLSTPICASTPIRTLPGADLISKGPSEPDDIVQHSKDCRRIPIDETIYSTPSSFDFRGFETPNCQRSNRHYGCRIKSQFVKIDENEIHSTPSGRDAYPTSSHHSFTYINRQRRRCPPASVFHSQVGDISVEALGADKSVLPSNVESSPLDDENENFEHRTSLNPTSENDLTQESTIAELVSLILPTGKKFRRSLAVIRSLNENSPLTVKHKGRRYSEFKDTLLNLQKRCSQVNSKVSTRPSLRPSLRGRTTLQKPPYELILELCGQKGPCTFSDVLPDKAYSNGRKLGEGVFGEVFIINRGPNQLSVLKIMPVEGSLLVNGSKQKTFEEIYVELYIAQTLSNLRNKSGRNVAEGFAEVLQIKLVKGQYPKQLVEFWHQFDETEGSENDAPDIFGDAQLFILLEQANGGEALDRWLERSSENQLLAVFKQVVLSLAAAESSSQFEHRDLHLGNVLVSKTSDTHVQFLIEGKDYVVETCGVKAVIIDYSLSRIAHGSSPVYFDLADDPDLFMGQGDIQFEVYRQMREDVCNEWSQFQPKTNVRWLAFLLEKFSVFLVDRKKSTKVKRSLNSIAETIEGLSSALEVAENLHGTKQ